jgi:hypothetical protein
LPRSFFLSILISASHNLLLLPRVYGQHCTKPSTGRPGSRVRVEERECPPHRAGSRARAPWQAGQWWWCKDSSRSARRTRPMIRGMHHAARCGDTLRSHRGSPQHGGRARRSEQRSGCTKAMSVKGRRDGSCSGGVTLIPFAPSSTFVTAFFRALVVGMRTRPTDQRGVPVATLELPPVIGAAGRAVVVVRGAHVLPRSSYGPDDVHRSSYARRGVVWRYCALVECLFSTVGARERSICKVDVSESRGAWMMGWRKR